MNDCAEVRKEYELVRSAAGLIDLPNLGLLRVSGQDRVRYLQNMLSNDIKRLRPGQGCYATLLTNQGRMQSDMYVYAFEEEFLIECPPSGKQRVLENLIRYLVSDIVQMEDYSEKLQAVSLQGPGSRPAAEKCLNQSLDGMEPLEHRSAEHSGDRHIIIRRDRTGCGGYDIWTPRTENAAFRNRCMENGAQPVRHEALNWLRTEAGIPWYGVDMDHRHLPLEFGLHSAVSLNKGCYRGQEIMARITYRGHLRKKFVGIAVHGERTPAPGTEVTNQGSTIGEVTSAAFSPRLESALALAIIKIEFSEPGTAVEFACGGAMIPGRVVRLPLQ